MRLYVKPELSVEYFEVEDVITVSATVSEAETFSDVSFPEELSSDPSVPTTSLEPTTEKPTETTKEPIIHEEEVMGGNPVQEVLNNLYDNFIQIF